MLDIRDWSIQERWEEDHNENHGPRRTKMIKEKGQPRVIRLAHWKDTGSSVNCIAMCVTFRFSVM